MTAPARYSPIASAPAIASRAIASTPTWPRASVRATDQVSGTSITATVAAHTASPAVGAPARCRTPPATISAEGRGGQQQRARVGCEALAHGSDDCGLRCTAATIGVTRHDSAHGRAADIAPAPRLPRPAGPDRRGQRLPRRRRAQHRRCRPALERRGPALHADGLRLRPRRRARGALPPLRGGGRRPAGDGPPLRRVERAQAGRDHGLARGPLPLGPALALAQRRAGRRRRRGGLQPSRPRRPGRVARAPLPPHAGRARTARRRPSARRWSCSARVDLLVLARYMQVLSAEFLRRLGRAGDQHPPQLPARLRRRRPLRAAPTSAASS